MSNDLAQLSTIISSNYPCLELIFMVPQVFEPLKFDCTKKIDRFVCHGSIVFLFTYLRYIRETGISPSPVDNVSKEDNICGVSSVPLFRKKAQNITIFKFSAVCFL